MLKMRLLLPLVIFCLALNNGMGAPTKARYMFVRCNPNGDQANCLTHQSPEMELNPDLPAKLPAAATQYIEAEPVAKDEEPMREEEEEESPAETTMFLPGEGSGGFEGSAAEAPLLADQAYMTAEPEAGSGESWEEKEMGLYKGLREDAKDTDLELLVPRRPLFGEAKPAEHELREDNLLQL